MTEPRISINEVELSSAQAMAVRVAVSSFLMTLQDPREKRELGEIGPLYEQRLNEVVKIMIG